MACKKRGHHPLLKKRRVQTLERLPNEDYRKKGGRSKLEGAHRAMGATEKARILRMESAIHTSSGLRKGGARHPFSSGRGGRRRVDGELH